jgi:hypothetical protein
MVIKMSKKMFAETIHINQEPQQVGDYTFKIIEKYVADVRDSWEDFMLDKLYEFYKKEGFTKVLMISKEDFKKFLLWALPKYKEEVIGDEKEQFVENLHKSLKKAEPILKDMIEVEDEEKSK